MTTTSRTGDVHHKNVVTSVNRWYLGIKSHTDPLPMFVMRFVGNFRQGSNSSEMTATFWLQPKRNFSRLTNHRDL